MSQSALLIFWFLKIKCVSEKNGIKEISQNCFSTANLRTFHQILFIASYYFIKRRKISVKLYSRFQSSWDIQVCNASFIIQINAVVKQIKSYKKLLNTWTNRFILRWDSKNLWLVKTKYIWSTISFFLLFLVSGLLLTNFAMLLYNKTSHLLLILFVPLLNFEYLSSILTLNKVWPLLFHLFYVVIRCNQNN